jgi:hypothetical protein
VLSLLLEYALKKVFRRLPDKKSDDPLFRWVVLTVQASLKVLSRHQFIEDHGSKPTHPTKNFDLADVLVGVSILFHQSSIFQVFHSVSALRAAILIYYGTPARLAGTFKRKDKFRRRLYNKRLFFNHFKKGFNYLGIKMSPRLLLNVVQNLFLRPGLPVGAVGEQRIPYINDGKDARCQGDLLAL